MNCPNDFIAAERIVAGTALLGADEFDKLSAIIRPEDFTDSAALLVFQAVGELRKAGEAISWTAVGIRLVETGRRAELGDAPERFLLKLQEAAGSGQEGEYAARTVAEASTRRTLRLIGASLTRDAARPGEPAEALAARFEREVRAAIDRNADAGEIVPIRVVLDSVTRRIDETATGQHKPTVITTGLPGIDKFLAGGLRPGQLAVLAARPGYGKSAAALCMARAAAEAGFPTLVVSLEMTADENAERLLAAATNVPLPRLRDANLTGDQPGRIAAEMEPTGLAGLPLYVCDRGGLSDSALATLVRTAVRRFGVKFVACDYLQLLRGDDAGVKRYQQVGASSRAMKSLAKETGVAFLCLAQLNREVESREGGKPRPSDLRDSGEIEQDADVILLLQPLDDDPTLRVHRVDCHVAKQRNGATGTVELDYVRYLTKFEPRSVDR